MRCGSIRRETRRVLARCKGAVCAWYLKCVVGRVRSSHGALSRGLQFPNRYRAPYRRAALGVARDGALGDVLMCTPALRLLKSLNPECKLSFYTMYPTLLEGLPFIDTVGAWNDRPRNAVYMRYEDSLPPKRHIAQIMGDYVGLNVVDVRPSCSVDDSLVDRFQSAWSDRPRPWIVVNRFAGPHTPNKDWPSAQWESLISELAADATVIEIGASSRAKEFCVKGNYINLAQQTSLKELPACIAAADLHVGPISGPVHIAAAVGTPSVVIYGGYEDPVCSKYHGNINIYSSISCAPCWLTTVCPHDKACLTAISVDRVRTAIDELWRVRGSNRATVPPISSISHT